MKRKEGFLLREVCGQKVIVAEGLDAIDFGKLVALNETAAWLWEEAGRQGDFTAGTLASALADVYDVTPETALADTTALLAQWQEMGIVE